LNTTSIMKNYQFNFGTDKIEFATFYFLKETVSVNGNMVSQKFTFKGTEHILKINSTEIVLQTTQKSFKNRSLQLKLFINRKLIESKILLQKRHIHHNY
jgi:hypothetical protein